jgi:hypothetical protein
MTQCRGARVARLIFYDSDAHEAAEVRAMSLHRCSSNAIVRQNGGIVCAHVD